MDTYKTCTCCGKTCFPNSYPEIVFFDEHNVICEECSIDYDMKDGRVIIREDLASEYNLPVYR